MNRKINSLRTFCSKELKKSSDRKKWSCAGWHLRVKWSISLKLVWLMWSCKLECLIPKLCQFGRVLANGNLDLSGFPRGCCQLRWICYLQQISPRNMILLRALKNIQKIVCFTLIKVKGRGKTWYDNTTTCNERLVGCNLTKRLDFFYSYLLPFVNFHTCR